MIKSANGRKFDYEELKCRIFKKFKTQKAFAEYLGISENALTNKLNGVYYFTQEEIARALDTLAVDSYFETVRLFFKEKVE
jgi:transcriptional regulator with XRE-family HTH domain